MRYVTSIERLAKEEGIIENVRESVIENLATRFEEVPTQVVEAVNQIDDVSVLIKINLKIKLKIKFLNQGTRKLINKLIIIAILVTIFNLVLLVLRFFLLLSHGFY